MMRWNHSSALYRFLYPSGGMAATVMEYVRMIGGALLLAAVIRTFIIEPYKIPSSSMMPTLLIGDYLFVSKYSYGTAIPFTSVILNESGPARGDIVVFRTNIKGMGSTNYIKRVVAVPGDTVAYTNRQLVIHGAPMVLTPDGMFEHTDGGRDFGGQRFVEQLGGITHSVLWRDPETIKNLPPVTVPSGMYVVVGDNRDDSFDSREWEYPSWGFVPRQAIVGRAEFLFWSWASNFMPRFDRLFNSLRPHEVAP
jgi:signal peptidase I